MFSRSARSSRLLVFSEKRFMAQAVSKAARKPRAMPVPRGQKGCGGKRILLCCSRISSFILEKIIYYSNFSRHILMIS